MEIKLYSYRFAEEILSGPETAAVRDELLRVCRDCPVPVYPGKSQRQPNKDVVQQIMNTYFRLRFASCGWEVEPLATPDDHEDALRGDFRKRFVLNDRKVITPQIEVEFGNVASSYRNYFKFQLSFSYGLADIGVLIVPSSELANRIDSGVANYEKAMREIPQAKLSVTVPILVIGLFDRTDDGAWVPPWDVPATGAPLDVAQNKNNGVRDAHEALVREYLDQLNRP